MKNNIFLMILVLSAAAVICTTLIFEKKSEYKQTEYEEITMVLPTYGYVPEDTPDILEKMNDLSVKACGVKVNYIFTCVSDLRVSNDIRMKAGEEIDLMPCMDSSTLADYISCGIIAPLDELLYAWGTGIMGSYPARLWEALGRNGQIYAVSPLNNFVSEEGLVIREDVLEAVGITKEELTEKWDIGRRHSIQEWDQFLTPLFEKIKSSDAVLSDGSRVSEMLLVPGNHNYGGIFSQCNVVEFESFGNLLGGIVNDSDRIMNLYETEAYRGKVELIHKWRDAGYIYSLNDQMNENSTIAYENGIAYGFFTDTSDGQEENIEKTSGFPIACISLVQRPVTSEMIQIGNWVIPASSRKKEEAMKILNLMFTDRDYVNLYLWGIEGRHYRTDDRGKREIISDRYNQNLNWMFGNVLLTEEDETEHTGEKYDEVGYSEYYGFLYDDKKYSEEIAQMNDILNRYLPELELGLCEDVKGTLDEMNQQLYEKGLADVMSDKQKQLDVWIANNEAGQ